jgi:hypothetical protein
MADQKKEGDEQHPPYVEQSARNQMRNMQAGIPRGTAKIPQQLDKL